MSANIPNDPVAIQRFFTSRDNNANAATYVGQEQRLWYNPITNAIYVSDGNTAGGILVGGGGSGNGVPGGPTNSIQYNAGSGTFGGTSNVVISGDGISVTGNVTTATFFIGNGSQLTGLPVQSGTYSNANVAAYLPTYSGNISGGNIGVSGAINAVGEITSFANIVVSSGGYFQGDGSQLTNLPIQPGTYSNANVSAYLPTYTGNLGPTNILTNNYLYANGQSIFANIQLTGNINLGNLYIIDETIYGKNLNANIGLSPEGDGWVTVPKLAIGTSNIALTGGKLQFDTPAGVDIQFAPGTSGNILTAGTVKPTANNVAGLGAVGSRYTDLWLGAGNINLIDQGIGVNQEIYVNNGNVILGNSAGIWAGNFRITDNSILLSDVSANMIIGNVSANGWVQFNRSIAVSTFTGQTAFSVSKNGRTNILTPDTIANTEAALNIVGSSTGNAQPRNFSGTMLQVTGQDNTPTRISFDAFGANGAQNSYAAIAGRAARGTVDSPQALQANDLMMRLTSQGWTGNGVYAPSIARLNFAAAENFTSNAAVGTYANIQLTPIGSNTIKTVTSFTANGVSFPNTGAGGTGNLGITFQDGSFQNTAYVDSNVVRSVSAGTGINIAPVNSSATGNITITNYGVTTVAGTVNQVYVNGNTTGGNSNSAVTLSLPQDISQNSSPTFNNLTVNNLSIIGNVSNVIPSVVDGKIVYVANTATQLADIDASGLITGSVANGFYAGMLYQTTGLEANTWNFTVGNSVGINAGILFADTANVAGNIHIGSQYQSSGPNYLNALLHGTYDGRDSYIQYVLQNLYQGANASADYVAVNNIGDDGNNYIDMGINSNVYNSLDYAATGANDGYLYVNGGNLIIGTQTPTKIIRFITGGTNSATAYNRATITDAGLSVAGNVTANNFSGNTLAATTVTGTTVSATSVTGTVVSVTGSITGPSIFGTTISATANVVAGNVRTAGQISAAGNIYGANLITATTTIDGGVSTTGNITGGNVITTGSVSVTGNVNTPNLNASIAIVSTLLSITGNIDGGNLRTSGIISTTGNAVFGNITTVGRASVTGNVDAGNLRTTGAVVATGNIGTSGYLLGDGGLISNITVAPGTKIVNGTSWANLATSGGNLDIVVGSAAVGTFTSTGANITGYATVSGNITGGNLIGQNLTAGRVAIVGSGKQVADDADLTYNATTNVLSVTGNVNAAYFNGNGSGLTGVTVSGNIGNVSQITFTNTVLGNAVAGTFEWDGNVFYGTPYDSQRGVVSTTQTFVLNSQISFAMGSSGTMSAALGYGVQLEGSIRYRYRAKISATHTSGGGTVMLYGLGVTGGGLTRHSYTAYSTTNNDATAYINAQNLTGNFGDGLKITASAANNAVYDVAIEGWIDVAGATVVAPLIGWNATGGSTVVYPQSSFEIWPVGVVGQNTAVGVWNAQ